MYKTYIFPIKDQNQAQHLSRCSGRIYSKTVSTIRKIKKQKNIWLSRFGMEKLIKLYAENFPMHSQSKQATVQQYYQSLESFFKARKDSDNTRPPYRTFRYQKVVYKKSAIKYKDNIIKFSNGQKGAPLVIKTTHFEGKIQYAEMIYNKQKQCYQMHVVIKTEGIAQIKNSDKVLSIDLGQIHPMVTFDGRNAHIFNGGELNSFIRFKNKELGHLQKKMAHCKKYSKQWNELKSAKMNLLNKTNLRLKTC